MSDFDKLEGHDPAAEEEATKPKAKKEEAEQPKAETKEPTPEAKPKK